MSTGDSALLTSELHKIAAEISTKMTTCQRTGQLSRYVLLNSAREMVYKAINLPAKDESQLTLEIATEGQPDASGNG